jgi:plastocyanin
MAKTVPVSVDDNSFNPPVVTINKGDSVEWTNNGSNNHTVTSVGSNLFDKVLNAGDPPFSYQFDNAGTIDYKCRFHNGMNGKVIVT